MSGIYIKGMVIPKTCVDCRFHKSIYCTLTDICTNTAQNCPLIPVPDHGRLIDADALMKLEVVPSDNWVFRAIEHAPIIIQSDKDNNMSLTKRRERNES